MPLTPFHWSSLLFGFLLFNTLYLPALAISSVLMDLEPFYYMFISPNPDGILHGFFHTYLGATIIALVVAFVLVKFRKETDNMMAIFRLEQKISDKGIYLSSIFAAYSHIFLDSLMHSDLKPFWPFSDSNPFLGLVHISDIYLMTGIGLTLAFGFYLLRLLKR